MSIATLKQSYTVFNVEDVTFIETAIYRPYGQLTAVILPGSCIFNLVTRGNGTFYPIWWKFQKTPNKLCRNYTLTSVSKFFLQRHVAVLKMQGLYLDTLIIGHKFC